MTDKPGADRKDASAVLVVEDDRDAREMVCELLEAAGHRAVGVADGGAALAYLRSNPAPDVIVLDMLMPRMDGWQFRREQHRTPALAKIPVVVISGLRVAERNALGWGASAFVLKPFSPDDLLGAISAAVSA